MLDENGNFTDEFKEKLPEILGDEYYNDPKTRQEPTKAFDDIKDLKTLAKSYIATKRLVGRKDAEFTEKIKGMVKVPGEGATEDEVKTFRRATGAPDSSDGYVLDIPDVESSTEKAGYEVIAKVIKDVAFTEGIPVSKLGKVWSKVVENLISQNKTIDEKAQALMNDDINKQKEKYKEKYDTFVATGNQAVAKLKTWTEVQKILEFCGIHNFPAIAELKAEIAPLVLEEATHLGGSGASGQIKDTGEFSYEYDEHGVPIK